MDSDDTSDFYSSDRDLSFSDCENLDSDDSDFDRAPAAAPSLAVLSQDDIRQRQHHSIARVATVLLIPNTHAALLLRHFKWDVSKLNEEWFADEERVRKSVGLFCKPSSQNFTSRGLITCAICFEPNPVDEMKATVCEEHYFCRLCWVEYMRCSINDGPGCLSLRCPHPSCAAAIDEDMVASLVSRDDRIKYSRYLLRSYVEDNKRARWCPAPDCEFAVEFDMPVSQGAYDVTCKCNHKFCWNCVEEAHSPVDCETVALWNLKNSSEAENTNWILVNSKPCPQCRRPIEKNQGCMHMTCAPPCRFQFCWLCLEAWSKHGLTTGGFYACNGYEATKKGGKYQEAEERRELARKALERYAHYYERWAANEVSRAKALSDLHDLQTVHIYDLREKLSQPLSQLQFISEAWLQIVECRRVMKWSYAYGYYLPQGEQNYEHAKRQFFEYLQGEAEVALERLHQCAEEDLKISLGGNAREMQSAIQEDSFGKFRIKLAGMTRVTRTYFENLVDALANGLADVDSSLQTENTSTMRRKASDSSPGSPISRRRVKQRGD